MKKTKTLKFLKIPLSIFIFCMMLSGFAYAQGKKITGVISDLKTAAPVAGATVTVKGTGKATVTDNAGRYSIQAAPGDVLIVTFTGRVSKEIKVGASGEINLMLEEDFNKLDEVVVIGYGSAKKRNVVGATDIISAKGAGATTSTNPAQLLIGKAAGVQVIQSNGTPGADAQIIIRGTGSFTSVEVELEDIAAA